MHNPEASSELLFAEANGMSTTSELVGTTNLKIVRDSTENVLREDTSVGERGDSVGRQSTDNGTSAESASLTTTVLEISQPAVVRVMSMKRLVRSSVNELHSEERPSTRSLDTEASSTIVKPVRWLVPREVAGMDTQDIVSCPQETHAL